MDIYGKKRKDVSKDLGIKYTTLTDYIKGNTYPNFETLRDLGYYFRVDGRDFLVDLSRRQDIVERARIYAQRLGTNGGEDYHSFEEYYETPLGYPVELLKGRFFVCESPSIRHQSIVSNLLFEFKSFISTKKGSCKVFPGPIDVEFSLDKDTVCVPDLVIICNPGLIKNMQRCQGAPDLIVEVLSPSSIEKDLIVKRDIYEEAGVREYWVIDPLENNVTVFARDSHSHKYPTHPTKYSFQDNIPVGIYEDYYIRLDELDIM